MQRIVSAALQPDVEFNPVQVAVDLLKVKELSTPRAEVVTRTEVHAAMMFAGREGAAKLSRDDGITLLKRWVPVQDERTRISHAAMGSVSPINYGCGLFGGRRTTGEAGRSSGERGERHQLSVRAGLRRRLTKNLTNSSEPMWPDATAENGGLISLIARRMTPPRCVGQRRA